METENENLVYTDTEELWETFTENERDEFVERHLFNLLTESPVKVKRILCRVVGVANYYEEDSFRNSLEPIITAK